MSSGLITITGRTNVGKSSLFNVLTGTDNAIVSRTDGYTLDYQEGACFSITVLPIIKLGATSLAT